MDANMIPVERQYASPSSIRVDEAETTLGLTANQRRPVRFRALVEDHVFHLREALQTLGELVWSGETRDWREELDLEPDRIVLDPVITVHPDRVFFEAFSQDQSAYGMVVAPRDLFDEEGEVRCGTTNVDFTAWLAEALGDMRSTRQTYFHVGPEGFEVETNEGTHHVEETVNVPEDWVRGFLQLQGAMSMPGTAIEVDPVDLLGVIRFLDQNKAHTSPRSLRYEFEPGEDARVALEPWDKRISFQDAHHHYGEPKETRVWGRQRLQLVERLLPYAESVEIYLKGRALPSFYAVHLPGDITFLLGLSGWTGNGWTETASFDLLTARRGDDGLVSLARSHLADRFEMTVDEMAEALERDTRQAASVLSRLCRLGLAVYDVRARAYRHRELFEEPIDEDAFYPKDPREEQAESMLDDDEVTIERDEIRDTTKTKQTPEGDTREVVYEDRVIQGRAGSQSEVEVVLNDEGRIIYGECQCSFFQENILNKGPCAHMLALFEHSLS